MTCPYPCQNKTEYGYCKTTGCINPKFDRTRTFTSYDPIEIARQYAPKFDKPVVDMVAVVRCKDCRYYCPNLIDEVTGLPMCGAWAAPQKPEGYCNYGAIKDEVEECQQTQK